MSGSNNINPAEKALLERLGKENTPFFVLMSACTREPYVQCDEVTFDDECMIFFEEEAAKEKAKELAREKIPVTVAKLESRQMLMFFSSLYTMGVNALRIDVPEQDPVIQLEKIVKRREHSELPDGSVWVENPQLHLTALYFAQELRRPAGSHTAERLKELQEELTADFKKARLLFAVEKGGQKTPMIQLKDGTKFQPVFTDAMEFGRFNREGTFTAAVVEASQVPKALDRAASGVILNIMGVNLPLSIGRPDKARMEQTEAEK